jgi:hypothetical protein
VATTAADTDNQVRRSLRPDRDFRADAKGHAVRLQRLIVPVLAALAVLLLVPGSALANRADTVQVKGIEYSATATAGKFAGAATGRSPGTWQATVVHEPITAAPTAPITSGSFQLYSHTKITGHFVDGAVRRLNTPTTCADERFDVRGDLALDGGGTGQFTVLLTHLRTTVGARCVTYAATVGGHVNAYPNRHGRRLIVASTAGAAAFVRSGAGPLPAPGAGWITAARTRSGQGGRSPWALLGRRG